MGAGDLRVTGEVLKVVEKEAAVNAVDAAGVVGAAIRGERRGEKSEGRGEVNTGKDGEAAMLSERPWPRNKAQVFGESCMNWGEARTTLGVGGVEGEDASMLSRSEACLAGDPRRSEAWGAGDPGAGDALSKAGRLGVKAPEWVELILVRLGGCARKGDGAYGGVVSCAERECSWPNAGARGVESSA